MAREGEMSKEEFKNFENFEFQIDSKLEELYTLIINNSAD